MARVRTYGIGGCSESSVSGTPYCPCQNISTSKQGQWPYHIWTSTLTDNSDCTGGTAYRARYLDGTGWYLGWLCTTTVASHLSMVADYTGFGSVRWL